MTIDYKCEKGHFKTVFCEVCLTDKREEMIRQRIRNQLRIHWGWLKDLKEYNEVADFVDSCIRQINSAGAAGTGDSGIGTAQA